MEWTAKQLISELPENLFAPELTGQTATYRFDVAGAASCFITCNSGHLHIVEGSGDADTVFVCDEQDFVDILLGKRNLLAAVLQGRVEVRGDISQALRLGGVLARADAVRVTGAAVAP